MPTSPDSNADRRKADASSHPGDGAEAGPGRGEPDPEKADPEKADPEKADSEKAGTVSGSDGSSGSGASFVAAGIFASRIVGLLRERVIAYFFGVGPLADVWAVAFRAPNLLQNLLGEGTISAAFIPTYSRMIEDGRREEAGRFAGAIFGLLLAVAAGTAVAGILLAQPIVAVLAPGLIDDPARVAAGELSVDRFTLSVQAVRIIFPMAGVLVLSAWALGVLNSHRRFFVPYVAPVLWNVAIIATLVGAALYWTGELASGTYSTDTLTQLLLAACGGAFVGGVLQFGVQLPFVAQSIEGFRLSLSTKVEGVRDAVRAVGPVIAGRGVAQLSGYLDQFLASFLAGGALSGLRFAQILYLLPISLFGISVTAAELPELSRLTEERRQAFVERLRRGLAQSAFLTVPTVIGYAAFGYLLVGAFLETGQFGAQDTWVVYVTLAGYSAGILATTISRLLQNAFYAIDDTKTPARLAVVRIAVSTTVALPVMYVLHEYSVTDLTGISFGGETLTLGVLGLSAGASAGAWVELAALVRALREPMPDATLPWSAIGRMTALALAAAVPAAVLWSVLPSWPPLALAPIVAGTYAATYLGGAVALGFPEIDAWTRRLRG